MREANEADVVAEVFGDDGTFPNSPLPLLLYRGALVPDAVTAEALETLFEANGWPPSWRNGIYTYHHYHSTAHECLGIASGEATVQLGGPEGKTFDIAAGDVIVIPAGVAHQKLQASADFLVIGAYPPNQEADLRRGEPDDRPQADHNIGRIPLPESDPVRGRGGPLTRLWR